MTALLALIGALVVGASDFGGGIAARQVSPLRVAAWIQAASLGLIITVVWFVDAPEVRGVDIGAGVVAGLAGTFSFVALYAAFSRGQISVLAPVSAVVGAIIPIVVGLFRGESLKAWHVLGIVMAMLAIVLVTRGGEDGASTRRPTPPVGFALALLAGAGFSVFFLALAETHEDAGLWPLLVARLVSVPVVSVIALTASGGVGMWKPLRWIVLVAGCAEGISNVFRSGPISEALWPSPPR